MNLYTLNGQSRFPLLDENRNPTKTSYEYEIVDQPNNIVKRRTFKGGELVDVSEPTRADELPRG